MSEPIKFFGRTEPLRYEGKDSTNPLAFRWYDKDRVVLGQAHGGASALRRCLLA